MFRIQDKGVAEHLLIELFRNGCAFYIQQYHPWSAPGGIEAKHPFDVRIIVIGDEIAGSMMRESPSDAQWKTNVHQGAMPRPYSPGNEEIELALKAAKSLRLEIAGVDLLHSSLTGSWIVLEANCAPGWTGLSNASNTDIPARIVDYYRRKLKC